MSTTSRLRPEQGWALGLASAASFMVVLDLLVVATALSSIRHALGATLGQLEWTINAYTLSFAVLLLTASALGDRFGRRRLFVAGLGLFAAASAACALAPGIGWLIAARAVQGAGAAMIMPLGLALLNAAFPPERRGWAMGIFGGVTGLAATLGPVVGGVITQDISWPWIFWLNVPVGLVALLLAATRLKESYGPRSALDLPGLGLGTAAALGLVWGLVRGNSVGWASPQVAGPLVAGVVLIGLFVARERRAAAPLLPLRLFGSRGFSAGNAAVFFWNASLTGAVFFMAQFQQVSQGLGPLDAGLRLLPWGVTPFLLGPVSGALADRVGGRPLIVTGLALQTAGLAWIAAVARVGLAYWALAGPMIVVGVGFALALPALTKSVVGLVAPGDIGKASGAFTTMRQLGGAFGVAIPAAVFASAGSYATPGAFANGFVAAIAVTAALGLAATVASLGLPPARAARTTAAGLADREPVDGGQLDGAQREAEQVEVGDNSLRAL